MLHLIYEKGILKSSNKIVVKINPRYYRPTEVDLLIGDAPKAYQKFKWKPKTSLKELVKIMTLYNFDRKKINLNYP